PPAVAEDAPLPDKTTFQSGDLLWPKMPGKYVPYNSGDRSGTDEDQHRWLTERRKFIANIREDRHYFSETDITEIQNLSFREFYARYAGDQKPDVPGLYASGAGIYVGHVGIIDIDSHKVPWVIEALYHHGVVRSQYDDWVSARPGEIVW